MTELPQYIGRLLGGDTFSRNIATEGRPTSPILCQLVCYRCENTERRWRYVLRRALEKHVGRSLLV
jgi:hypothetical protein